MPFLQTVESNLETRQAPADKVFIISQLARLANHFRADRPADAWQMLFEDYADDLAGVSEAHLVEAIRAHRADSPWFPKVSEILNRCQALRYQEAEKLRRARVMLGKEPPKPWERKPYVMPDEAAQ